MKNLFAGIFKVGLFIFLYTGITSGIYALFDYGFMAMINIMFNPFILTPFWAVVTFIQDACLIVGGIGMLLAPAETVNLGDMIDGGLDASPVYNDETTNEYQAVESNDDSSNTDIFNQ